jgi:bacillithiol biosynthesis cysteine-adding enzyme BshC
VTTSGLTSTASAPTTRIPIDIRRFPWIRRLAADYAYDFSRLTPFFAGNPADAEAWRSTIARVRQKERDRNAITDVLAAQQRRRGAPAEALAAAQRLRDPDSVAVVTGQQAGLFGGPLFTLLKALTAIKLAESVARDHGVPAVAVFWIDAEDHDWDEVKSAGVLDASEDLKTIDIGNPPGAGEQPVARVALDQGATAAVEALAAALPPSEFTAHLVDGLRAAYAPGTGMAEAFGRWLESMLGRHGLVVFDSADPAAKPLAAPVFVRELDHIGESARLAADAGARLEALGYHAQVTPQPDQASLFHLNGGRQSIGTGQKDLAARAKSHPQEFSPNVLLRPVVQDTLFPTVCYVAGPNELAYLGQLRGIYDAFGVPMPLMAPRASATILDSNAMRFLARSEMPFEALSAQDEAALNRLLEAQLPASVEQAVENADQALQERMALLAAAVTQIDATLEGATRSALSRMQDDLKKLHGKIIQAAKRKDETLRRQFTHARALAFPGGHPQERTLGVVSFLNKYGPGFVDRLSEDFPLDGGTHWVMTI